MKIKIQFIVLRKIYFLFWEFETFCTSKVFEILNISSLIFNNNSVND